MAIYISGVRNLPEQVQKNKDDIEDLKQDSATKTELQAVADDMEALEGRMDTAEGDIGGLTPRVQALENKTQQLSYDDVNNRENFSGDVEIDGNVLVNSMQNKDGYGAITLPNQANDDVVVVNASGGTAHFLKYDKDGNLEIDGNVLVNSMQNKDSYGALTLPNQPNDDVVVVNASGGTAHILRFDKDGNLTIDGNPVGGTTLYQHNIRLRQSGGNQSYICFNIINTKSTQMTITEISQYLYDGHRRDINTGLATPVSGGGIQFFIIYSSNGTATKFSSINYTDGTTATSDGTLAFSSDYVVAIS